MFFFSSRRRHTRFKCDWSSDVCSSDLETLGDEAAEAVQVNEVGEFKAVTKGSAGGENRVPQAQRANFYAEINGASGTHFAQKDTTKRFRSAQDLTAIQSLVPGVSRNMPRFES